MLDQDPCPTEAEWEADHREAYMLMCAGIFNRWVGDAQSEDPLTRTAAIELFRQAAFFPTYFRCINLASWLTNRKPREILEALMERAGVTLEELGEDVA